MYSNSRLSKYVNRATFEFLGVSSGNTIRLVFSFFSQFCLFMLLIKLKYLEDIPPPVPTAVLEYSESEMQRTREKGKNNKWQQLLWTNLGSSFLLDASAASAGA